jgi:hypothetical protein
MVLVVVDGIRVSFHVGRLPTRFYKMVSRRCSYVIPSPQLLVVATSERRVPTLVATSGSHWLK